MIRFVSVISLAAMFLGCETIESVVDENVPIVEETVAEPAAPSSAGDRDSSSSSSSSNLSYGGFLWKPVSESTGKLVVLLPSQMTGNVLRDQVVISSNADGSGLIETGSFAGDTHNGGREHYRFSKSGSGYGKNIYVYARLKDGGQQSWFIPDGASRVE